MWISVVCMSNAMDVGDGGQDSPRIPLLAGQANDVVVEMDALEKKRARHDTMSGLISASRENWMAFYPNNAESTLQRVIERRETEIKDMRHKLSRCRTCYKDGGWDTNFAVFGMSLLLGSFASAGLMLFIPLDC